MSEELIERLRGALSWIEPPFVTVETSADEMRSRIRFCLADAERALAAIEAMPDERALKLVEALRGVRSMLAGYAGQPNHMGDIYKVVDAALADSQPAGERR